MSLFVRKVTSDDRIEVLGELSAGIYDGHDYLPYRFDRWMIDGIHTMFACVAAHSTNVIVGLDTIAVFDDDQTIMFQALRVHAGYRGAGIASTLTKHLMTYVAEHCKRAKCLRVTTLQSNQHSLHLHFKQGYTMQAQYRFVRVLAVSTTVSTNTLDDFAINFMDLKAAWTAMMKRASQPVLFYDWSTPNLTMLSIAQFQALGGYFVRSTESESIMSCLWNERCSGWEFSCTLYWKKSDGEHTLTGLIQLAFALVAAEAHSHASSQHYVDFFFDGDEPTHVDFEAMFSSVDKMDYAVMLEKPLCLSQQETETEKYKLAP